MGLTSSLEMVRSAQAQGYAVAGFAAYNLETIKALMQTADDLHAPILMQTTGSTIDHAGLQYLAKLARLVAEDVGVPVALHLDHGESLGRVRACLSAGYTSIMVDGSHLGYEENVAFVREAVALAHAQGVPVEAELGRIGGVEDDLHVAAHDAGLTDPDQAREFVDRTGCDFLAPAIGTAHGMYHGVPHLDFERLQAIRERVSVPLVLHGASGLPDALVRQAIGNGVAKVNIASELKQAFGNALRAYLVEHPDENDPRRYFLPAVAAYQAVVRQKIQMAGKDPWSGR